jgi:hypothetical protein
VNKKVILLSEADYLAALSRLQKAHKTIKEEIRASERLSAEDYAMRVNAIDNKMLGGVLYVCNKKDPTTRL